MLLLASILLFLIALSPYLIFLLGIYFGKKSVESRALTEYPDISIIMSAYNEELVIRKRIANIQECSYPKDSIEIIFVDDCSSDGTKKLAKSFLERSGINYQLIENRERMGTNRSYNFAITRAHHSVIVTTDADVFFEPDALNYLIDRLFSDEKIAAVTGELRPIVNSSRTTELEGVYRSFYGRMCEWESALDSTYNFNGALVAFRSDRISRINDKLGADDANTAFEAIRKGYRAVYEKKAIVYEDIPRSFKIQYRQKTRRATGLIEATLSNLDLLGKDTPFSRFFYPLRIFMYAGSPIIFLISAVLFCLWLILLNPLYLILFIGFYAALGTARRQNLVYAFTLNQFYLLAGLLNLGKDMRIWESTSDKKKNSP
ncbi:MAG: glycosyltransferase [Methanoregula sp.]|jgi:cellulose synthase/poly-beta-1,6-N-acetylglucosamine synthase-like glycosyltransferase